MEAIHLVSLYRNLSHIFKGFPQHNPNTNPAFPGLGKNPRYLWFSISLSISKRLRTVRFQNSLFTVHFACVHVIGPTKRSAVRKLASVKDLLSTKSHKLQGNSALNISKELQID